MPMKSDSQVRWGVIGCGEATEAKSGPALQCVEGSMIAAVMSRDKEKARSYAQRHGIQHFYTDPVELINDRNVNAIYIATPPSSHATFAIMAMKAGKPAYVEKPLASSYEECLRVNNVSQQTGVRCYLLVNSITTRRIFRGVCSPTLLGQVGIFMIWQVISLTCCSICLA